MKHLSSDSAHFAAFGTAPSSFQCCKYFSGLTLIPTRILRGKPKLDDTWDPRYPESIEKRLRMTYMIVHIADWYFKLSETKRYNALQRSHVHSSSTSTKVRQHPVDVFPYGASKHLRNQAKAKPRSELPLQQDSEL